MARSKGVSHYLIFATVAMALVLSGIGGTAVSVAFPVLTAEFGTNLILAGWVLNVTQLVCVAVMPLAGKVSEVFGYKRTFIACLILWILGSLFSALSPDIYSLIASRLVQSVGAAGFLPIASGIVAEEYYESRQQVIGLFSSIFPIGQIIGPNLGAWLVTSFGWRSIFWLNLPLSILPLIAGIVLLKGEPGRRMSVDFTGSGLFTASVLALLVGLNEMGVVSSPADWAWVGLLIGASIALMWLFLRHERRVEDPIIDLAFLRERPFAASNFYNIVLGASYFGITSFIPLYAVYVYGMSTLESGLILTPMWLGLMIASAATSVSLVRWGYRCPILIGSGLAIAATVVLGLQLFSQPGATASSPAATAVLIIALALTGIGMGISFPAANNACIELMPERVATIAGLRGSARQAGGAVAIAVMTTVLNVVGDMSRGFNLVFLGLAIFSLVSLPAVFAMPANCNVPAPKVASERPH